MVERAARPRLFGWWGVVLAWAAWGLTNVLRLGAMPEFGWQKAILYGFPDAVLWALVTPLLVAASRRFEVRSSDPGVRRWLHVACLALTSVLVVVGHTAIDAAIASAPAGFERFGMVWQEVFLQVLRYELYTRLLICLLVIGLAHYQIYARRLAEQRAHSDRLAAQLTSARLASLQQQLRPHFLFNALNSVAASMEGSPQRGRRVVRRLGELLRASLRAETEHWIPLRQELDLVRAYLEIEQVRFEDRLEIDIGAEPAALDCPVPALLLQPLVENAVNHGIARRIDGGRIAVRARLVGGVLRLAVEDMGAEVAPAPLEGRSGIGLSNTRDRLQALYSDRAALSFEVAATGALVTLELPARRSEAA